jgi:hypothetical protein
MASGAEGSTDAGQDVDDISADGRYLAFYSFASNLVAGDAQGISSCVTLLGASPTACQSMERRSLTRFE